MPGLVGKIARETAGRADDVLFEVSYTVDKGKGLKSHKVQIAPSVARGHYAVIVSDDWISTGQAFGMIGVIEQVDALLTGVREMDIDLRWTAEGLRKVRAVVKGSMAERTFGNRRAGAMILAAMELRPSYAVRRMAAVYGGVTAVAEVM